MSANSSIPQNLPTGTPPVDFQTSTVTQKEAAEATSLPASPTPKNPALQQEISTQLKKLNLVVEKPTTVAPQITTPPQQPVPITSGGSPVIQKIPIESIPVKPPIATTEPVQVNETANNPASNPNIQPIPDKPAASTATNSTAPKQSIESVSISDAEAQAVPQKENPFIYLRPLRTYEGDVADAVKSKNASLVRIAVAENVRKQKTEPARIEPKSPILKNILIFMLSVALLAGGGYLVYTFYYIPQQRTPAVKEFAVESLVTPDTQKEFPVTLENSGNIQSTLVASKTTTNKTLNAITEFYFTQAQEGGKALLPSTSFMNLLDTDAPQAFIRSLDPRFMFGFHEFNGTHPFLILKTNFYQSAFAGMLKWEETMANDLGTLFVRPSLLANTEAGRPATTADILRSSKPFADVVIKNKDIRMLTDEYEHPILLYTFADKDTIIITTNEFTLKEILDRMVNRRFVR